MLLNSLGVAMFHSPNEVTTSMSRQDPMHERPYEMTLADYIIPGQRQNYFECVSSVTFRDTLNPQSAISLAPAQGKLFYCPHP